MRTASDVDDLRIGRPEVVHVDSQPGSGSGQEVGQEHVAAAGQIEEDLARGRMLEGQADAALPSVGVLHQRLEGPLGDATGTDLQPALGVSGNGVLHLDHVSAPIGEDGARGRGKGELGYLKNADTRHRLHADLTLLLSVRSPSTMITAPVTRIRALLACNR